MTGDRTRTGIALTVIEHKRPPKRKKPRAIADILRRAIHDSGLSAAKLGQITDVKQQTISEFLSGKDIRLATAQKLADYFGIEVLIHKS